MGFAQDVTLASPIKASRFLNFLLQRPHLQALVSHLDFGVGDSYMHSDGSPRTTWASKCAAGKSAVAPLLFTCRALRQVKLPTLPSWELENVFTACSHLPDLKGLLVRNNQVLQWATQVDNPVDVATISGDRILNSVAHMKQLQSLRLVCVTSWPSSARLPATLSTLHLLSCDLTLENASALLKNELPALRCLKIENGVLDGTICPAFFDLLQPHAPQLETFELGWLPTVDEVPTGFLKSLLHRMIHLKVLRLEGLLTAAYRLDPLPPQLECLRLNQPVASIASLVRLICDKENAESLKTLDVMLERPCGADEEDALQVSVRWRMHLLRALLMTVAVSLLAQLSALVQDVALALCSPA